ncbi:uncharacterized protein J3R85_004788 [Psidium guajava]|nr:uncharacterized protein J3R85_004788 [Psidium guajava]
MAVAKGRGRDGPDFSALPEGCIARVVSFTSLADACRLASVSRIFKSACDSNAVWDSFLPPDCRLMVSRDVSSLKELYFSLCDDPVLIGDGKRVSLPRLPHLEPPLPIFVLRLKGVICDNCSSCDLCDVLSPASCSFLVE